MPSLRRAHLALAFAFVSLAPAKAKVELFAGGLVAKVDGAFVIAR